MQHQLAAIDPPHLDAVRASRFAQTEMHGVSLLRAIRISCHNLPDGNAAIVADRHMPPTGDFPPPSSRNRKPIQLPVSFKSFR